MDTSSRRLFDTYNPISLQARVLSCNRTQAGYDHQDYIGNAAHHASRSDPPPSYGANRMLALEALGLIQSVGVVELYRESLCLMEFQVRGNLPSGCTCEEPRRRREVKNASEVLHDVRQISDNEEEAKLMDVLAKPDTHVYRESLMVCVTSRL